MKIRFYTLPPRGVDYPWLFVPIHKYKLLFKYRFEHAIVDCGVEKIFNHGGLRDYPPYFLSWYKAKARFLSKVFGDKVWIVIPDYPDDYRPGQTYGDGVDNVDKTIMNIEEFMSIDGVEWLPVIQSRYEDTFSFLSACQRLTRILNNYRRVAVGTVCKARKLGWIIYCLKTARVFFKKAWIHAFGLTLNALSHLKNNVWLNSFDSTAYTFPRGRRKPSAKNSRQREQYFYEYLRRLEEILDQ